MSIFPNVEIVDSCVVNAIISSIPYGQINNIQVQANLIKIYYTDGTFGEGSLYLFFDSLTYLCSWQFNPHLIYHNNEIYGLAVSDPEILNYHQKTNNENYKQLEYSLNSVLENTTIYSSEIELLFFFQISIHLYFREPKYSNINAATFEEAKQKVLYELSKEIDEYKKQYHYQLKEFSIRKVAWDLFKEDFCTKKITPENYRYRDPFGEDIVAKIPLIKRFPNEWRLLVESSHDRYMTVFLDEEFSVIDAKKGMFMK